MQRHLRVHVVERHGARDGLDDRDLTIAPGLEILGEERDVTERRAHQQELHVVEHEERQLPRDAAISIAVEVELVDHDRVDLRLHAVVQGDVREDLRRAADHGRVAVHRGIARHEADVLCAELVAQREELLRHERLDRRRVVGASTFRQALEVQGERDERLPRSRRGVEDHVLVREQREDRLFLGGVEGQALRRHVIHEALEEDLGRGLGAGRETVDESHVGESTRSFLGRGTARAFWGEMVDDGASLAHRDTSRRHP